MTLPIVTSLQGINAHSKLAFMWAQRHSLHPAVSYQACRRFLLPISLRVGDSFHYILEITLEAHMLAVDWLRAK